MNITIQRLADHTGLSSATISRILNGKGAHKPETVARVKRVLNHLSSRDQAGAERECIGIVLLAYPRFLSEIYTSSMLSAILETLAGEGIVAQLIPVNGTPLTLEDAELLVEKFNLRGLLVQELGAIDSVTGPLDRLPVPVVRVGDVRGSEKRRYVVHCDNRQLGANAAAYLWNLGYRDFGIIYTANGDYGQEQRHCGFVEQIKRFGGDPDAIWQWEAPHINLEIAITACVDFLKLSPRPKVIFFAQGCLTRLFYNQVRRNNIDVPRELFLLGVEDDDELSKAELPVATIGFPARELGSAAASMLIDLMRRDPAVETERRVNCDSQVRVGPACLVAINPGSK